MEERSGRKQGTGGRKRIGKRKKKREKTKGKEKEEKDQKDSKQAVEEWRCAAKKNSQKGKVDRKNGKTPRKGEDSG